MEEWRPIADYPDYLVSSLGRIKSLKGGGERILCAPKNVYGYSQLVLFNKGRKAMVVHRLVAEAFIPNPERLPTVDHINRVRTDNTVANLRWASMKDQMSNKDYPPSSTGHKYISRCRRGYITLYIPRRFKQNFPTLEEAILYRDAYLDAEKAEQGVV